jgi:hypothetical protein
MMLRDHLNMPAFALPE